MNNERKEIRWGIIGCGDVTEVKSGPAFQKVPRSSLRMVMRRDGEKAANYACRHGVPQWTTDAAALIHHPEVDAVYIATPPAAHEAYTVQALQAGKPVYVEKPMACTAAEAQRMAKAVEQTGGKLCVAHYRRRQPQFLKVKELLDGGAVGRVQTLTLRFLRPHRPPSEGSWRLDPAVSGGGLFYDLAPHQLDLLLYFFGPPLQLSGASLNTGGHYAADDTTAGQIVFQNNILFNGLWCFSAGETADRCEVSGTEGRLSFSVFDQQPVLLQTGGTEVRFAFDPLPHVQQPMIEKVVDYFLGDAPNPCPAEDGLMVMKMMEALANRCASATTT